MDLTESFLRTERELLHHVERTDARSSKRSLKLLRKLRCRFEDARTSPRAYDVRELIDYMDVYDKKVDLIYGSVIPTVDNAGFRHAMRLLMTDAREALVEMCKQKVANNLKGVEQRVSMS